MYYHLFVSLLSFFIAFFSTIGNNYKLSLFILGIIALFVFLKILLNHITNEFLKEARIVEKENKRQFPFFKGKYIRIEKENIPEGSATIIFSDGEKEIPLYCENPQVIQTAIQTKEEVIIYYKENILLDIILL